MPRITNCNKHQWYCYIHSMNITFICFLWVITVVNFIVFSLSLSPSARYCLINGDVDNTTCFCTLIKYVLCFVKVNQFYLLKDLIYLCIHICVYSFIIPCKILIYFVGTNEENMCWCKFLSKQFMPSKNFQYLVGRYRQISMN